MAELMPIFLKFFWVEPANLNQPIRIVGWRLFAVVTAAILRLVSVHWSRKEAGRDRHIR
jgi:hypothetical protein